MICRRQPRDGLAREHRAPARRRVHRSCTTTSREHLEIDEPVDFVYHLASPASPIDYLRLPLQTLKVGSYGTHNALGLAKWKRARFLLASTSEVYGDPRGAPAAGDLLGERQPDRPARRVRRGEALRRGADDGLPPPAGRRHVRSSGSSTPTARACGRTTAARSRTSSARRSSEKPLTVFGDGSQTRSFCYVDDLIRGLILLAESRRAPAGQHRQPRRVHAARAGRGRHRGHRLDEPDRLRGAAGRRPAGAPARHHARAAAARLGARDRARRRPSPHAGVAREGPGTCLGACCGARRGRLVGRRVVLRAQRVGVDARSRSGSSTTGSSSTASPTRLPAAPQDADAAAPRQPLVGGAGDQRRDTQADERPADPTIRPTTGTPTTARSAFSIVNNIQPIFSIIGTPAVGERGEGLERRARRTRVTCAVRGRGAEALQRHVRNADGVTLPRVSLWMAWNEPNNPVFLKPQYRRAGKTLGDPVADATTRRSATRSSRASSPSQRSSKVACGATGPRGNNNPNSSRPVRRRRCRSCVR